MRASVQGFSPEASNVLRYAQEEAMRLNRKIVGSEHMLLALVREEAGLAGRVLKDAGLSLEPTRTAVAELTGPARSLGGAPVALTLSVQQALELAVDMAEQTHQEEINTGHLLLGLLTRGGVVMDVLNHFGIQGELVQERVRQELAQTGGKER
ncbi:MAG: hypothetical protein C4310_08385 [Chloroflexota bacterium]